MAGTDPFDVDTDGDDIPDGWEFEYGLDAIANDASSDSDFDGMPNLWEYLNGLHPGIYDRYDDLDGDGVQNIQEYQWGTDANNLDSDGDGLTDWEEAYLFSSFYQPQYADTDCAPPPYGINNCDGINDGDEDYDSDIMPNIWELVHGFDPTDPSDGITDAD